MSDSLEEGFDFDVSLVAEEGLADARKDPLKWFRYSSEAQGDLVRWVVNGYEVYLRAGNQAGKTTVAATLAIALARGVMVLDGIPLPVLETPNVGAVLGKSYKQMAESSIKALREALGDWPHKLEMGSQGTVVAIRVKPERSTSDDWKSWSRILILPQDGEKPVGMRLDWAWADEPPKEDYWHELRARGKANRPFLRFITMTPEDRREWEWLRREFAGCEKPGADGRVELRLSVFDNRALGKAHLRDLEQMWKKDPIAKARLFGDYIDTTGTCPFDGEGLARWEALCRPPDKVLRLGLYEGYTGTFEVEQWFEPEAGEQYLVVVDPSSGTVDDERTHDPAGLVVIARGRRRLVARWNGYAPAHRVGRLAAELAQQYNRAMVVWERNSGYGESFYLGLGGYGNIYIEHHHDTRTLPFMERLGWATTATTRGVVIGALQKAILEDGLVMLSRAALESLRDVIIDKMGRMVAAPGRHDEDMIVLGLSCHLLETMPFVREDVRASEALEAKGGIFWRPEDRGTEYAEW